MVGVKSLAIDPVKECVNKVNMKDRRHYSQTVF